LYARYGTRGGEPYAPEVLLGLLLYGYATGVFSSRKIEHATYETVPFRFIAGNLHQTMTHSPRSGARSCQSLLIVGCVLSNHPNDSQEAEPTLVSISACIGVPNAAALDAGYFGPATLSACAKRGIDPYIATSRDPHHPSWQQRFAALPEPPPLDASPQVQMAYKLKTALGKAIYGARKWTVEPVIGIIKEVLGFRQFSLRGELAAAGEWSLVCLAFNLKRFHTLSLP
jgi:hypothetical protein